MGASPHTIERIDRAVRIVEFDDGTRWRIHPKAEKAIAQWKVGDQEIGRAHV